MLYAAIDAGERSNARAREVLSRESALVTTDHVLVETWLIVNRRLGLEPAERFWHEVRRGAVAVEPVGAADLEAAWAIGAAFPDQGFSIVDRTSFAVMERLGIHRCATFDDDFAVYRFGRNRDRAFDVLR